MEVIFEPKQLSTGPDGLSLAGSPGTDLTWLPAFLIIQIALRSNAVAGMEHGKTVDGARKGTNPAWT